MILCFLVLDNVALLSETKFSDTNITNSKLTKSKFNIKTEVINPKISLVMSGGGARGFAQIGVLKSLEENNIEISNIVGTSIGALIGGLYSSGYSANELDSLARNTDWNEIFSLNNEQKRNDLFIDQKLENDRSLLKLRFNGTELQVPKAISTGNSFNSFLQNLVWRSGYQPYGDFNKLKYPFRAVTTDLISGNVVPISYGDFVKAIRASATVPLRYTPIEMDSMLLVDGGILANIPINQTAEFNPEFIIAINSTTPKYDKNNLNTPWNIADQVVTTMSEKLNDWYKTPNLLITPPIGDYSNTNFDSVSTLINFGYNEANIYLENFKRDVYKYKDSIFKKSFLDYVNKNNKENIFSLIKNDSVKFKYVNCKNYEENIIYNYFQKNSNNLNNFYFDCSYDFFNMLNNYKELNIHINNGIIYFELVNYEVVKSVEIVLDYNKNQQMLATKESDNDYKFVKELASILNSQVIGDYYSDKFIKKIELKVSKYLRDNKLYFKNLNEVDFNQSNGTLKIIINPIVIDKIFIKGKVNISDYQIFRELTFNSGDSPNPDELSKSWNNLVSTDLFYYVGFDFNLDTNYNKLNIIITVEEKGTNIINIGAKTDNERQGQISFDLKKDNLFQSGTSIYASLFGGNRNQYLSFNIENTRISSTNLGFKITSYYDSRNIYRYEFLDDNTIARNEYKTERIGQWTFERIGAKLNLSTQILRIGKLYGEFRYEKQRTRDLITETVEPFYQITTLKVGSIFDTENDKYYPSKGSLIYLDFESSILNNIDKFSFTRVNLYYHTYIGNSTFVLKPKLIFGAADITTPVPEQYGLGNEPNFFGMREEENRGRQIFITSLEARYKLPFKILFDSYISTRYDLGNVWSLPTDIKFSTLKHGIGLTLGIYSTIGTAKFSLGRSFYFIKNPNSVVLGELLGYFSIGAKL